MGFKLQGFEVLGFVGLGVKVSGLEFAPVCRAFRVQGL